MQTTCLSFYDSFVTGYLDTLQKEFDSKAEDVYGTRNGIEFHARYIMDEDNQSYQTFEDYLQQRSLVAAAEIQKNIQKELDASPGTITLNTWLTQIKDLSTRLKIDLTLKKYSFLSEHLDQIAEGLKQLYGSNNQEQQPTSTSQKINVKLTWTGGVASLATLFFELHNESFDDHPQPFIRATKNQILRFIQDNFVDEHGEPFSESTLATYLDPNKPEKKAKRKKAPLDDIFTKKKQ